MGTSRKLSGCISTRGCRRPQAKLFSERRKSRGNIGQQPHLRPQGARPSFTVPLYNTTTRALFSLGDLFFLIEGFWRLAVFNEAHKRCLLMDFLKSVFWSLCIMHLSAFRVGIFKAFFWLQLAVWSPFFRSLREWGQSGQTTFISFFIQSAPEARCWNEEGDNCEGPNPWR